MGSDSGKSGDQNKSSPNFFGNMAEDLGNIFSGNVNSPHSAYDVRNADSMADKYGRDPNDAKRANDWLPGGRYGPGSGSYSLSEFHAAGVAGQKAASETRDGQNRQGALDSESTQHRQRAFRYSAKGVGPNDAGLLEKKRNPRRRP